MQEFILCNRVQSTIVFVSRIKHNFQKHSLALAGLLFNGVTLIAITVVRLLVLDTEIIQRL